MLEDHKKIDMDKPLVGAGSREGRRVTNPKGRAKGSKNKLKVSKAFLREEYRRVHEAVGGFEGLVEFAKANPGEFRRLQSQLEPKQVGLDEDSVVSLADLAKKLAKV